MKKLLHVLLVALFLSSMVLLAACEQENGGTNGNGGTTVVDNDDDDSSDEVPFSEIGSSMLDSKKSKGTKEDGYSSYVFKQGAGDCLEKGFPKEFMYLYDLNLEYHVVRSADRSYFDQYVSLDFNGNLRFDGVELDDGTSDCLAKTTVGSDDATLSCEVDGAEVCTATFKVFAVK